MPDDILQNEALQAAVSVLPGNYNFEVSSALLAPPADLCTQPGACRSPKRCGGSNNWLPRWWPCNSLRVFSCTPASSATYWRRALPLLLLKHACPFKC